MKERKANEKKKNKKTLSKQSELTHHIMKNNSEDGACASAQK